jgi:hypothetical protein
LPILSVAAIVLIITTWAKSKKDILIIGFMSTRAIWLLSSFYMLFMSAFSEKGMMPILGLTWLILYFPMTAIPRLGIPRLPPGVESAYPRVKMRE